MNKSLKARKSERGQGLVEYALILVLVAVAVIGVMAVVGQGVSNVYCTVVGTMNKTSSCTSAGTAGPTSTPGTLAANGWATTSNQSRWHITYNGTLTDGVTVTCTASSGPVIVQNDGGGDYVLTLTSSFHGSFSCSMSYQSATGSFAGNFS